MKTKNIIGLISATGAFVICYKFVFISQLIISLGLAAVTFIVSRALAGRAVSAREKKSASPERNSPQAGEIIKQGMARLRSIRNQTINIRNNETAHKIQEICRIGHDIFDDISKNPNDLRRAKPFINYYLEATEKIVTRYVELSNISPSTAEIEQALARTESILDTIRETYQKQLMHLREDDLLDLNTEITVLEKTMKLEG